MAKGDDRQRERTRIRLCRSISSDFACRTELAKLQLERGQALAGAGREAQLQWQSDLLDNQVQRVKEETRDGMQSIGLYPRWWW